MLTLENNLSQIKGIGQQFLTRLHKLKIKTVKDLLWHFPSRYEDFSEISEIDNLEVGQTATVFAQVESISCRQTRRRGFSIVEAIISDDSGSIKVVWFNQPYITKSLPRGKTGTFSGKVTTAREEIYLSNPLFGHQNGLLAVYPETKGLTSKGLRYLIKAILKNIGQLKEFIPTEVLKKNKLPSINSALNGVHFPKTIEESQSGKRRFAFEDIFLLQIHNSQNRFHLATKKATAIPYSKEQLKKIVSYIPFSLTDSQKEALVEIINDIKRDRPMNRLLQGDVGSGKTVVAAIAALLTAEAGYQTVFMAPTEVLARQHYHTFTKFFSALIEEHKLTLGLLTGGETRLFAGKELESKIKKNELSKQVAKGSVKIIIGTHALIQKNIKFDKLALAVIDEQHRFGVRQRAILAGKNPHFLSMSATPIPRTLTMTLFGDLDLSLIDELPSGRQPIITKIVAPTNRKKAYEFIREQIQQGRQAFVICPRIEAKDCEEIKPQQKGFQFAIANSWADVKAVEEEYKRLSEEIFPDLQVAMLHGRLKSQEKTERMSDFSQNKTNIIVSTSVVEIGVDVPNATIMMIEDADRFGLAQLYQFRGRVGRGEHQSYCLLFTNSSSSSTHRRLNSLLEAKNGFELAEKDLALRGPGQFLGQSQTGLPDMAMSSLSDTTLIKTARDSAEKVIKKDSQLNSHPNLKERLKKFRKQLHQE